MILPSFPAGQFGIARSGRGEEPSGEKVRRLIQIRFSDTESEKVPLTCQGNRRRARSISKF